MLSDKLEVHVAHLISILDYSLRIFLKKICNNLLLLFPHTQKPLRVYPHLHEILLICSRLSQKYSYTQTSSKYRISPSMRMVCCSLSCIMCINMHKRGGGKFLCDVIRVSKKEADQQDFSYDDETGCSGYGDSLIKNMYHTITGSNQSQKDLPQLSTSPAQ